MLLGIVYRPLAAQPACTPASRSGCLLAQSTDPATQPPSTKPPAKETDAVFSRRTDISRLPRPVAEMLDAILVAVNSGDIEELRTAIEWNELPPAFTTGDGVDEPIAALKKAASDENGHAILAIIANLLAMGPARQPLGRDPENSAVYIWPYLAERPLDQLTPAEQVDLHRIVPAEEIAQMRAAKRWTWYRIVIGADGTWHAFMRDTAAAPAAP